MKAKPKTDEIELIPDAWERFGDFVKQIAKAGPQHRKPKQGPIPEERAKTNDRKRGRGSGI